MGINLSSPLGPWDIGQNIPVSATSSGTVPPLTWSAVGFPSGITINSVTGVISGIVGGPAAVDPATITVVDSGGVILSVGTTFQFGIGV